MHVAQVDFVWEEDPSDAEQDAKNQEINHAIEWLTSVWRTHGRVAGSEFPSIETPRSLRFWLMIPRADALAPQHDSQYARRAYEKLASYGVRVEIEVLDPEPSGLQPCQCSRPSLILYTNYSSLESPLRCLSCFGPIPLYEIPEQPTGVYKGELHDQIRSWMSDYASCDSLQMNCTTGERFGLRQMGDPKSSLSRQGRTIASRIEEALQLRTFYYLHRYRGRSLKSERARLCPLCGAEWRLDEKMHDLFDFKCDGCRLLSNIALSIG